MFDAVFAPRELTLVMQQCLLLSSLVQTDSIAGYLFQPHTADGAYLCSEITMQQVFAKSYALENLCATIASYSRDTHLRHYLLQTLVHCLDIVGFGSSILLLYPFTLHQVVEDGEGHVRTQSAGSIAQK